MVEVEFERCGGVEVPFGLGPPRGVGMELFICGAGAPEFVDTFGENASADQGSSCGFRGETDNTVWGLEGY